jgi:hypothetical protein
VVKAFYGVSTLYEQDADKNDKLFSQLFNY